MAKTPDLPAKEQSRRARLDYQRRVQEKVRKQQAKMYEAKKDLARKQEVKDRKLEEERQREATRQWWKQPSSSSTLAWVHSGGARGTSQGETRQWGGHANQSLMVNFNDTVINLNSTKDEIEVLDLDQTLTEQHNLDIEQEQEEAAATDNTRERNMGEKAKKGRGKGGKEDKTS